MILKRLRVETAASHAALEARLPLLDPALSLAAYCGLLKRFWGYYAPLEAQIVAGLALIERQFNYADRVKIHRLENDLISLGQTITGIPRCSNLPVLAALPQVLGSLYVIEGATLGGQIITRHLQSNLRVSPESGAAFFSGYGVETGPRWKAFGIFLTETAARLNEDDLIIQSANATFETLGQWLFSN